MSFSDFNLRMRTVTATNETDDPYVSTEAMRSRLFHGIKMTRMISHLLWTTAVFFPVRFHWVLHSVFDTMMAPNSGGQGNKWRSSRMISRSQKFIESLREVYGVFYLALLRLVVCTAIMGRT